MTPPSNKKEPIEKYCRISEITTCYPVRITAGTAISGFLFVRTVIKWIFGGRTKSRHFVPCNGSESGPWKCAQSKKYNIALPNYLIRFAVSYRPSLPRNAFMFRMRRKLFDTLRTFCALRPFDELPSRQADA